MKLQDKENLDIASAVSDVLEGKQKKEYSMPMKPREDEYDAKDDHTMDPTSHVKKDKDSGMFCVYNMKGKKVAEFKTKDEADAYAKKNHDALMKKESPEPPNSPSGKLGQDSGERDFAGKHKVKKSGKKMDGSDIKEEATITLEIGELDEAAKPGRGKTKLDIDYIGDKALTKKAEKKYKIKIKQTGRTTADVSGEKKNIIGFMKDPDIMGMDDMDLEDLYPALYEATKEEGYMDVEEGEELSDKQKKYQAFFKKALKKFGVESPSELDDAKKKEFFNYVDKNYDAGEGESD